MVDDVVRESTGGPYPALRSQPMVVQNILASSLSTPCVDLSLLRCMHSAAQFA